MSMSKSSFTRKNEDKKYDAIWFALDDAYSNVTAHKRQFKVKFENRLHSDAQDQAQEVHRQLFLHKLNRIRPDIVRFREPSFFSWDHTRRELESINVFFLRNLPKDSYRFEHSIDLHDARHNRKLKDSVMEKYPSLQQFVPFYDIIQVFNREGSLKYFLAQNGRPFSVPNKALSKPPFGNAEYYPDQTEQANVFNYYLLTVNSEMAMKVICNDLTSGSIVSVQIGRNRIGRIHLSPLGEILLMNETLPPDDDSENYTVKSEYFPKEKIYIFTVCGVSRKNVIAKITCKFWKNLTAKNLNKTRMFGVFFNNKVNIVVKSLVLGAAFIIVHDFYRIYWNGNTHKKLKVTTACKRKPKDDSEAAAPVFNYHIPRLFPFFKLSKNEYRFKE